MARPAPDRAASGTAAARRLKVLVLKDRYQSSFMSPRSSRHKLVRKRFAPFNYISSAFDGFTVLEPSFRVDLVHAQNRIPIGAAKSVVSFESHLPRRFGLGDRNPLLAVMRRHIAAPGCRRIIGMSHFAARVFLQQHDDAAEREALFSKLMVRHPSLPLGDRPDLYDPGSDKGPLTLVFVGGHFARKGGCVAVRMAELALERGLPIRVEVISSLAVGGAIWTDPTREGFFDRYLKLLELPNVDALGSQPNAVVRERLAKAHFSLLPTFADTFGFSAIESMAEHTPVIGATVGALPEFITDGVNGLMLPLETDAVGEWIGLDYHRRGELAYERRFDEAVDALAEAGLARLAPFFEDRAALAPLRRAARQTALDMFDARKRSDEWDALYARIAAEPRKSQPILDPVLDRNSPNGWPGGQSSSAS